MALTVDHPSVIETWFEVHVPNEGRTRATGGKGVRPIGNIVLVVRTSLPTHQDKPGFDSGDWDDLLAAVDYALASSANYSSARVVGTNDA